MLVPRLHGAAPWVAFGTALAALRHHFPRAVSDLPPLQRDQIVLLDGNPDRRYRYLSAGRVPTIFGEGDGFWLEMGDGSRIGLLNQHRLRLQPCQTRRNPSPPARLPMPPRDPLDGLLGIEALGNRSIFTTFVILITGVGAARSVLHKATVQHRPEGRNAPVGPFDLLRLFQCGALRTNGEVYSLSPGQYDASPVLLLAPDLLSVRDYLRSGAHRQPLILLDGAASFANRFDVLDEVLDEGCPAFALVERHETEHVGPLRERSFNLWAWERSDVERLTATGTHRPTDGSLFAPLNQALHNFARHTVTPRPCTDDNLQEARRLFLQLAVRLSDLPEGAIIEGRLMGCLLHLSRCALPVARDAADAAAFRERLDQVLDQVRNLGVWLDDQAMQLTDRLEAVLRGVLEAQATGPCAKGVQLRKLMEQSRAPRIAVVMADAEEAEKAQRAWKVFFSRKGLDVIGSRITFYGPSEVDRVRDLRQIILCGWLNSNRMCRLLDGCLAPQVDVLVYPFEQQWLSSACQRWSRVAVSTVRRHERARLLGITLETMPEDGAASPPPAPPPVSTAEEPTDVTEQENRLRDAWIREAVRARPGESVIEAWQVRFQGGFFSFLTEGHGVPVVTDLLSGVVEEASDLENKRVRQLRAGDYVVFREGSQTNLIREMADVQLKRTGRAPLRQLSGMWRDALNRFVGVESCAGVTTSRKKQLQVAVDRLLEAGIQRHPSTIRGWLLDDSCIGPQDQERVIPIIAKVTGDPALQAKHAAVARAIDQVRSVHLEASGYLIRQLFARLPRQVDGAEMGPSLAVEIEGLGRARVVRVEEIAPRPDFVAWCRVNSLLREEN